MDIAKFEKKAVEVISQSCKEAAAVAYRDAAFDVFKAAREIKGSHPEIAEKFKAVSDAICDKANAIEK